MWKYEFIIILVALSFKEDFCEIPVDLSIRYCSVTDLIYNNLEVDFDEGPFDRIPELGYLDYQKRAPLISDLGE